MAKPFSSRLAPLGELVLVRKPKTEKAKVKVPGLVLVEKDQDSGKNVVVDAKAAPRSMGVVVEVGPGCWEYGKLTPIDERIRVGATVLFPAEASFRFPDIEEMAEEGLWFVPASTILCVLAPEGVRREAITA